MSPDSHMKLIRHYKYIKAAWLDNKKTCESTLPKQINTIPFYYKLCGSCFILNSDTRVLSSYSPQACTNRYLFCES